MRNVGRDRPDSRARNTRCRSRSTIRARTASSAPADDQTFQTFALRPAPGQDRAVHQRDDGNDATSTRRVRRQPALLGQVDGADLVRLHLVDDAHAHRQAAARGRAPRRSSISVRSDVRRQRPETSTLWNYKVIGRYVMPWDIGLSGSWKVQSGFNYARTISVTMPVEGSRTIRVEHACDENPAHRERPPSRARSPRPSAPVVRVFAIPAAEGSA